MNISHTAAYIAIKLYGLTRNPAIARAFDPFILNFYEQMVLGLPRHLTWYHRSLKNGLLRRFFIFTEELFLPGDLMHILCRKFYIGKKTEEALEDDVEQIVNLGAGFDHLGAFYARRGIPVFEIDLPTMVERKKDFLEVHNFTHKHLHLISADATKNRIAEALRAHEAFDPKKKTLFVAEGFFDYLSLLPSEHILEDIQNLNKHNELLTTFFSLDELNLFHRSVFRTGVSMVGEALQFKITKDDFVELLDEVGFALEDELSHQMMRADFIQSVGSKLPVLKGFYVLKFSVR